VTFSDSILRLLDHRVAIGSADMGLAAELTAAVNLSSRRPQFCVSTTLGEFRARLESEAVSVAVVHDSILGQASLAETMLQLTEAAPLVVLAPPWRQSDFFRGIENGDVEFVATVGDFVSLAAAFIARRLRWADLADSATGLPWRELPPEFGSILRHEINNPLTGILGNSELLLSHLRGKIAPGSLQRLETVVDLAVRLRETTRRLGNACEREQAQARTA